MRAYILIPIFVQVASTSAQLITMDNAPQIGDQFTLRMGTYIDLPQTGSDQIWDYSVITSGAALAHQFEDAAGHAQAGDYPEASLVLTGNGSSEFFSLDGSALYSHGSVTDIAWNQLQLNEPQRRIIFPLYQGASWQDEWSGMQNGISITGTKACVANGSGELVLPWGTLQEVIRVSCIDQAEINDGSTTIEILSVTFHLNGFPWEALRATERTVLENGQQISPTQRTLLYATEASVVSVDEGSNAELGDYSYFDPNGDLVIVRPGATHRSEVQLHSLSGVLVSRIISNNDRITLRTKHLSAGTYILNMNDADGGSFREKLVIGPQR